MKISVLFFGLAHELSGVRQLPMEVPVGTDTSRLRQMLAEQYAGLDDRLGYALAVNEVHCAQSVMLKEGDVVAILPPVSGG